MLDMKTIKTITIITTKKDFEGTRNIADCNCSELRDFYFEKVIDSEKFYKNNGKEWVESNNSKFGFNLVARIHDEEEKAIKTLFQSCEKQNIPIPEQFCGYTPRGKQNPKPFWVSDDGLFYIFHDVQSIGSTADKLKTHVNALVEFIKREYENEDIKVFMLLHRSDYPENPDDKVLSYSYYEPGEKLDNELLTVRLFSHEDSPIVSFIDNIIGRKLDVTIEQLWKEIEPTLIDSELINPELMLYRVINSIAELNPENLSSKRLSSFNNILESRDLKNKAIHRIKEIVERDSKNAISHISQTSDDLDKEILNELFKFQDENSI